MQLRVANENDIADLVNLGQRLIDEAPNYSERPFNPEALKQNLQSVLDSTGTIFIVVSGSNIVGGIVCLTTKDWFNDDLIAFEQVLYVKPEYRVTRAPLMLIDAFVEWAKSMNADRIQCGTTTGIQTKGCLRLYKKFGFREHGVVLDMGLKND